MNAVFRSSGAILVLISAPVLAVAGECDVNFRTEGDPRNGAEYATSARLADTTPASALGQLQAIAAADGFRVLNEDLGAGTLSIEQSKGVRPFLIHWSARSVGTATEVAVNTRLNRGATARAEDIRSGMCGMVARIKPGAAGEALAAQARKASDRGQVVAITAVALGEELGKARRRTPPEILAARYRGRRYTVDGQVSAPIETGAGLQIWFSVYQGDGGWLLGQTRDQRNSIVWPVVTCDVAPEHAARAMKLNEKDWATMTGTVHDYLPGAPDRLALKDCRFN
ncbi:hypothetical protein [Pseudoxanthomonas sp.]|uniref:hypothetical protein n=1 Tax=Pseudoxanthomonas sp. TaxID=1871049 RepID=UPI003F80A6D2